MKNRQTDRGSELMEKKFPESLDALRAIGGRDTYDSFPARMVMCSPLTLALGMVLFGIMEGKNPAILYIFGGILLALAETVHLGIRKFHS